MSDDKKNDDTISKDKKKEIDSMFADAIRKIPTPSLAGLLGSAASGLLGGEKDRQQKSLTEQMGISKEMMKRSGFGGARTAGKTRLQMLQDKRRREALTNTNKDPGYWLQDMSKQSRGIGVTEYDYKGDLPSILSKEGKMRLQNARYLMASGRNPALALKMVDAVLVEIEHGKGAEETDKAIKEVKRLQEGIEDEEQPNKKSESYDW